MCLVARLFKNDRPQFAQVQALCAGDTNARREPSLRDLRLQCREQLLRTARCARAFGRVVGAAVRANKKVALSHRHGRAKSATTNARRTEATSTVYTFARSSIRSRYREN